MNSYPNTYTHTFMKTHACTHTHTHIHIHTHMYICKRIVKFVTVEIKSHLFLPETLKTTVQNETRIITLELNGSQMEMSDVSTRMILTVNLRARYSEENQLLNVDFNFKILCIILI